MSWRPSLGLAVGLVVLFAPEAVADLLVLRDGTRQAGTLQACVAGQCRLDGRALPTARIAWIGFGPEAGAHGGEGESPPPVSDSGQDEIHLADGSVATGKLQGISLGEIAFADRTFDRADARWLHFAGAPGTPPPGPGSAPPPPPPPPPGGGGPGPTASPVTPGGLWIGSAEATSSMADSSASTTLHVTAEVRMREYNGSLREIRTGRVIGEITYLIPEGTVIHNQFSQTGSGWSCTGEGTETVSATYATADMSHSSVILRRTADGDLASTLGFDIDRSSPTYVLDVVTRGNPHFTVSCVSSTGASTREDAFAGILIGSTPIVPRYDPTVHHLEGGRMVGRYRVEGPIEGMTTVASWSVCPEGMRCEPAAVPAPR